MELENEEGKGNNKSYKDSYIQFVTLKSNMLSFVYVWWEEQTKFVIKVAPKYFFSLKD